MRTTTVLAGFLFLAFLIAPVPKLGTDVVSAQSMDPGHSKRALAVNLLRAINTAELDYKMKHGHYATWDVLVKDEGFSKGTKWASQNDPELANVQFSSAPNILPGWSLRLDLTASGAAYDLLLEDTTDRTCGYAAITDERGLIRQSKTIDCDI